MRLAIALVCALVAMAELTSAQTVVGDRLQLSSGPCTLRSGTGAPASGLGAVCDTYFRSDSPYAVYVKTGSSTWAPVYIPSGLTTGDILFASGTSSVGSVAAVSTGQVLTSAGTGTAPVYSATPSVTTITATSSTAGSGVVASSVTPQWWLMETDAAADNGKWQFRGNAEAFQMRAVNDAFSAASTFLNVERTGSAVDNVTIQPSAGDIILAPGGLDILPDVGYTKNLGALTNKYLTLHAAELWVETLVAQNTIATIGGRILVGPTTTLTADVAAAATSIVVKHNQMASGDRVVMQANGALEWMAITSAPSGGGPYTYTVTRNLDGTGANDWAAGDAVFNTGTTGKGSIDLYSTSGVLSGSGPSIVGNVRTGTTYSDLAPRWAIGNLNGVYGYGAETYGAAFGDSSATNVTIDATNGFRIRSGTTNKLIADTSGNLSIVGDLSVGTAGIIRSGATSYSSGTGYVLDYNSGTPRLRVGTTAGNRLAWDGTDLTLVSANLTVGSSGVSISPSTVYAATRSYGFTVATGNLGTFGAEGGGTGVGRALYSVAEWTGTGNISNGVRAYLGALHTPSSGGATRRAELTLSADSSASQAIVGALELVTDAAFVPLSTANFTFTSGIAFSADTVVPTGGIAQTTVDGLTLKAVAGSTRDFTVLSTGGTAVIGIAGTEIGFSGVSGDGTGKVLCVKSDASIGTCDASSIGASTCTCS